MKLSQLSLALPVAGDARSPRRVRLGPRQVTALAALEVAPHYALQELLNSVQELAQGPFQGEAQMHQAALALAADLGRLGSDAVRLLQPLPGADPGQAGVDLQA